MRGEREFLVSSDMKLKDFKVKVKYLTSSTCVIQLDLFSLKFCFLS